MSASDPDARQASDPPRPETAAGGDASPPRSPGTSSATPPGLSPRPSPQSSPRGLNLALQGGGVHGAFTWGVLDRLLESGLFRWDGISGTSAGAVNAVALAAGLAEGGAEGARARLRAVWRAVAGTAFPVGSRLYPFDLLPTGPIDALSVLAFRQLTQVMSPYQFNPLDINPLRGVLEGLIDFDALRRQPLSLFIAATEVASGGARVFRTPEVTVDAVLASTCLPTLFKAIEIDGRHYWDGGFSANPDLSTLVAECRTADTLLVLLNPLRDGELPTGRTAIAGSIDRITFNQPLRHEIALMAQQGWAGGGAARRLRRARFHLIEAPRLDHHSRLKPDRGTLDRLFAAGRDAAEAWLARDADAVGRRQSFDLRAALLAPDEDVA